MMIMVDMNTAPWPVREQYERQIQQQMAAAQYDDGGRGKSVPIGPDQLPPPDPRLVNGFGGAPVRETIPVVRHPAGEAEGRGGQFK
jgi:hypothetical protein